MYSKETENLKLPQWQFGDHPDFLTDINKAFRTIDKDVSQALDEHEELNKKVDELTLNMDNIQEEFIVIKEKVDSLYYLEDNPVFIALKERVDVCEERLDSVDTNLQGHQAAIEELQRDFSDLSSAVELLRNDMEDGDEALQTQINAHGTTLEDHWTHIKNLEETSAHILTELTEAKEDIKQLKEVSGQHTTDIQYLKAQQDSDDTRLTAIELKDSEQDAQLEALTTRTENLTETTNNNSSRLTAVESTLRTNSENIQALQNTTNNLKGRVEALESEGGGGAVDPEITTRLSVLEGAVGEWANRDSNLIPEADITQAITNLVSGQNTQNTNISKNMNDIAALNTRADSVESELDGVKSDITAVTERVDSLDNAVVSGLTRIDGEINDVKAQVNNLDDTVAENTTSIETLRDTNNTLASKVADLESALEETQGTIASLESDNTALTNKITELESSNQSLQNQINAVDTKVDNAISGGSIVPNFAYNVKLNSYTISANNNSQNNITANGGVIRSSYPVQGYVRTYGTVNGVRSSAAKPAKLTLNLTATGNYKIIAYCNNTQVAEGNGSINGTVNIAQLISGGTGNITVAIEFRDNVSDGGHFSTIAYNTIQISNT